MRRALRAAAERVAGARATRPHPPLPAVVLSKVTDVSQCPCLVNGNEQDVARKVMRMVTGNQTCLKGLVSTWRRAPGSLGNCSAWCTRCQRHTQVDSLWQTQPCCAELLQQKLPNGGNANLTCIVLVSAQYLLAVIYKHNQHGRGKKDCQRLNPWVCCLPSMMDAAHVSQGCSEKEKRGMSLSFLKAKKIKRTVSRADHSYVSL